MFAWMVSAIVFTICIAIMVYGTDRALHALGRETRFVWIAAILAAVCWPVVVPVFRRMMTTPVASVTTSSRGVEVVAGQGVGLITPSLAQRIEPFLPSLWMAVSAVVLLRILVSIASLRRISRASRMEVVDGVDVFVHESAGPAVVGVLRPRILIPDSVLVLDESLRAVVLQHEREHIRTHDPAYVLVAALANVVMPWNAALWWLTHRARLAIEMDCDRRVLRGHVDAAQYGKLLLLIAQWRRLPALAPMLAESSSNLERRIDAMLPDRPGSRRARLALAAGIVITGVVAACTSRIADVVTAPEPSANARSANASGPALSEAPAMPMAQEVPGSPQPRYPELLRAANVQGSVTAGFVVDSEGRAVPGSVKIFQADHELFAKSVALAIPNMRFTPPTLNGKRVRQLQQEVFSFTLSQSNPAPSVQHRASAAPSTTKALAPTEPEAIAIVTPSRMLAEEPVMPPPGHAKQLSGNVRYPDILRTAHVEGSVETQFIVQPDGTVLPGSLKVLKSSHELFTTAVRNAIPMLRFEAPMLDGTAVRQLQELTFTFSLPKE